MSKEELVKRIPEDGTVEWANYVNENYSTEYFKPVDLLRAGMILERDRWNRALETLKSKQESY